MKREISAVEAVILDVHLTAGVAGPDALDFDVRCFLVPHRDGVVLVDTCMPGSLELIGTTLTKLGAAWQDISDIVLTHAHLDHVGGLPDVFAKAGSPPVWAGEEDHDQIPLEGDLRPLSEGTDVRVLLAVETPGHTPGHRSLLHEEKSLMFLGDLAGSDGSSSRRSPATFTQDQGQAEKSIGRVAKLRVDRVLFSHGAGWLPWAASEPAAVVPARRSRRGSMRHQQGMHQRVGSLPVDSMWC